MNELKNRVYALKAIAPVPLLIANRRKDYQHQGISPEKNYINQRLNVGMFYMEQLSVAPREKSMEEKSRTIRDLIMRPLTTLESNAEQQSNQ